MAPSKPFVFAPVSTSTKAPTGFDFSMPTNLKTETDQKPKLGTPGGDSATVDSSKKEERKSPVITDTKSHIVGLGFGTGMKAVVYLVVLEYCEYCI